MAGYCGFSKSNNAIDAENMGLASATKAAKILGVTPLAIKEVLEPCEWHHTSKFYNPTNYYDLDQIEEQDIHQMKEFVKKQKEKLKKGRITEGTIEYLEWSGTRKRPIAIKKSFSGEIEIRGCFYYFDGIRKKIGSNGTYFYEKSSN